MKILLVEDEDDKSRAISQHLAEVLGDKLELRLCHSLRGGLRAISEANNFDLILLDMSMPGFEPQSGDPAIIEEPESFAGEEILAQMKLRELKSPVVVLTQYKAFASGTIGLEELVRKYEIEYSGFFIGAIYYSTAVESWKKELADTINRINDASPSR